MRRRAGAERNGGGENVQERKAGAALLRWPCL